MPLFKVATRHLARSSFPSSLRLAMDVSQYVPRLPTETWREIFRRATYVPQLLHPEAAWTAWPVSCRCLGACRSFDDDAPQSCARCEGDQDVRRDTALITRRNIVSVCRLWRTIGLEFLWEVIQIRPSSAIQQHGHEELNRMLEGLADIICSPSNHKYGGWIKRIDIVTPQEVQSSAQSLISLQRALKEIHSLLIFNFICLGCDHPNDYSELYLTLSKKIHLNLRWMSFLGTSSWNASTKSFPHPLPSLDFSTLSTLCVFYDDISLGTLATN